MSPVASAVIETLAFMRITSASISSSLKKPRFSATAGVKNAASRLDTEMRTLSAASQGLTTSQAGHRAASIAIATFLIEKRRLSLTIFLSGFEDGLSDRAIGATTANVAAQPCGNLRASRVGIVG